MLPISGIAKELDFVFRARYAWSKHRPQSLLFTGHPSDLPIDEPALDRSEWCWEEYLFTRHGVRIVSSSASGRIETTNNYR